MDRSDFDYNLPEELIAQQPAPVRDRSRLMSVDRSGGRVSHHIFSELPEMLRGGDLLVANDSRVFSARLHPVVANDRRAVELLLLQPTGRYSWEALARPGRRLRAGVELDLQGHRLTVTRQLPDGKKEVDFEDLEAPQVIKLCDALGEIPLPPYIRRQARSEDRNRYQTVYAANTGSVAAPTAGLHFTRAVLERLNARGIEVAYVTLHVGYGTFKPLRRRTIEEHKMDREQFLIPQETAEAIAQAKEQGRRIVAVGTTSVRALESTALGGGRVRAGSDWTDLFICPGFKFQVTDALLTNFHLPMSSLYILVAAFMGLELTCRSYTMAIRERYRFYSYGDCMLIE